MTGLHHQLLLLLPLLSASFVVSREQNTDSDSFLHPQFVYHDENWVVKFLHNITDTFPHLTHMYSIGQSVEGLPCAYCFSQYLDTNSFVSEPVSGVYKILLTAILKGFNSETFLRIQANLC